MLTEIEKARYSRHILLSEIGESGQEKLKNAKVLVLGAGGLGCPALLYLASAGIGKIGIMDFDTVDESNLQRQVLYDAADIGRSKAEIAKQKLSKQNPLIKIKSICQRLTTQNALDVFSGYDLILDGTDNFSTRYLVNDACVLLEKTFISGSIFKFNGQLSVFNYLSGPTYRCLFPSPPPPGSTPSCAETGVLGILPGMIGTMMANEAIKMITGIGEVLSGKVLLVDALSMDIKCVKIERSEESLQAVPKNAAEFIKNDYDLFCGLKNINSSVKEISAKELLALISSDKNIQLLDVRDPNEHPAVPELNALNIPLKEIELHSDKISKEKKVIVFCRSGARSQKAIELLTKKAEFRNLYNLKGGVLEWIHTTREMQKA